MTGYVNGAGFLSYHESEMIMQTLEALMAVGIPAFPVRVSDLLCMSNLVHASATKEHDNDDDYQGTFRRAAERR